jgi:hypothetical protein
MRFHKLTFNRSLFSLTEDHHVQRLVQRASKRQSDRIRINDRHASFPDTPCDPGLDDHIFSSKAVDYAILSLSRFEPLDILPNLWLADNFIHVGFHKAR